jgi:hypothetical protein
MSNANAAHLRREKFIEFHTKSKALEMRMIYEICRQGDYQLLGFSNMRDYCEAPIESGGLDISYSWATQLSKVYEKYSIELGVSDNELTALPLRKLYQLKDKVTKDNIKDITAKVLTTSLEDLQYADKDMTTCKHTSITNTDQQWWTKCKECGATIKK